MGMSGQFITSERAGSSMLQQLKDTDRDYIPLRLKKRDLVQHTGKATVFYQQGYARTCIPRKLQS